MSKERAVSAGIEQAGVMPVAVMIRLAPGAIHHLVDGGGAQLGYDGGDRQQPGCHEGQPAEP